MKRSSYQSGSVTRKPRKLGPDVWVFRYADDGKQKSKILGDVKKYPRKSDAQKVAIKRLAEINDRKAGIIMSGLCDRFERDALPERHSTSGPYLSHLKRIREFWGDWRVSDMAEDIVAVEQWVNEMQTLGSKNTAARPASKKTKLHMKAFLHRLFELAMKWNLLTMQRNPMALIEVKGKRVKRPLILLTSKQYQAIIDDPELIPMVKVMIQVALILGLRASEFLGLRWEDLDFEKRVITIRRSQVGQHTDETKTISSGAELPMHDDLAAILEAWKATNTENEILVTEWVFENITTGRPFWRGILQQNHLIPAGKRVGIPNLGWHTFRHTYRAIMGQENIPLELQKSLMRHSDISVTLGYGRGPSMDTMREANAKVVEMWKRRA